MTMSTKAGYPAPALDCCLRVPRQHAGLRRAEQAIFDVEKKLMGPTLRLTELEVAFQYPFVGTSCGCALLGFRQHLISHCQMQFLFAETFFQLTRKMLKGCLICVSIFGAGKREPGGCSNDNAARSVCAGVGRCRCSHVQPVCWAWGAET